MNESPETPRAQPGPTPAPPLGDAPRTEVPAPPGAPRETPPPAAPPAEAGAPQPAPAPGGLQRDEPPAPAGRGLLSRWFEPVRVSRGAAAELRELASRGSLVFAMRAPGLLDLLYLRFFLRRAGLPPLRAAQGFRGPLGWLSRMRRSRGAFEAAIAAGDASVVFLGGRPGERDPFAAAVRLQRDLFQPVFLVPALLVWSRRPQKLKPSVWDVLFGAPEAPSMLANAIAFLRNFRRAFFVVGRPLELKGVLAERPEEPDATVARKVRGVLHQRLAREFRTAVGPPLKAPSRVRDNVLRDRGLRATVDVVARETGRAPSAVLAEAERDLREIASRYDPRFVQLLRPVLAWMFRRLYTSVEVDEEGLARMKRAASGAPIVLCPSHKSHVDYLVVSWLLYEHGMTAPHVAAGINLAFWPFGAIARRGGAFFIRRKVKGDRVYTAVLRAYVKHLLRDRFPQEFFVEGGRSRTGKLVYPKTGLVSMEVDAWLDGAAEDVLFVPMAIDYEKLIEASSYARELAGARKEKESLRGLLGAARVLLRRYERLHVQFGEPISLRGLAAEQVGAHAASLSVDEAWGGEAARPAPGAGARSTPAAAKHRLVQALANRIAYGITRAATVTPVGLVAAALLSHVRRGLGAAEVTRRVELLRDVAARGGARLARDLAGAPPDPRVPGPIADAVRQLEADGLVRAATAAGEIIYQVPDERRPVLDYHRNAVLNWFVAPALVAAAARGAGEPTVGELRAATLWLSRLLKLEFVYRPGAAFDRLFDETLAFLVRVGALARDGERVRRGPDGRTLDFLAELVRACLEAYRLAASTGVELLQRAGGTPNRATLVGEALERGRAAFLAGGLSASEAVSKAALENAVEWMVSEGVLAEEGGKLSLRDPRAGGLRAIADSLALIVGR